MNLPRVTEIISPFNDFSRVPPDVLQAASERGTEVHEACAAYALGLWNPDIEKYSGYIHSFKTWFDEYVVEVLAVEEEVRHPKWGYIGHVDLIARISGVKKKHVVAVIDYKTPFSESRSWRVQTSAYVEAAKEKYGVEIGGALRLRKDGSLPIMTWIDDHNQAFNAFVGILNGFNYLRKG